MSQSLSKLYIHIISNIKPGSKAVILSKDKNELYAYIGGIIKEKDSTPIIINGMPDHIHIFCVLSKNIALSRLIMEIKSSSSRWIKKKNTHYTGFSWQKGYAAFSVSSSLFDITKRYIEKQEEQHKKLSFKEEYLLFLKEYKVDYDEDYLWTDIEVLLYCSFRAQKTD